ncbi:MAG: hypothetical protein GY928_22050 [Colwellia sp.]|nr:hypothetical protein [Colwellia sp.]
MKNIQSVKLASLLVFLLINIIPHQAAAESKRFKVVAYQKYNTMSNFNSHAIEYTDQLIYKLIRVKPSGDLDLLPSTLADLKSLTKNSKKQTQVKFLIGIGGAHVHSEHFSEMAASSIARNNFIKNITAFCQKHRLDGVDVDWEYPESSQDKSNALILFKELRNAFDQSNLYLSAAVTYSSEQVHFAKSIEPYVDQINLMVYEPMAGLDTFQQKIDYAMMLVKKEKLNLNKLIMGLPFYGQHLISKKAAFYKDIMALKSKGDQNYHNIEYVGVKNISTLANSMKREGLGGVMFWELGFDTPVSSANSLLRAIHLAVK